MPFPTVAQNLLWILGLPPLHPLCKHLGVCIIPGLPKLVPTLLRLLIMSTDTSLTSALSARWDSSSFVEVSHGLSLPTGIAVFSFHRSSSLEDTPAARESQAEYSSAPLSSSACSPLVASAPFSSACAASSCISPAGCPRFFSSFRRSWSEHFSSSSCAPSS
jgi:hypothetical protein